MIDDSELIRVFRAHSGLTEERARAGVRATLAALGEVLTADEATRLGRGLPTELAAALVASPLAGPHGAPWDRARFVSRVAHHAELGLSAALDLATGVCAALGSVLDDEARHHLQRALGEGGALFEPQTEGKPAARVHPSSPPARSTLAEGRPGSRHPLADSAPHGAQAGSVADANPHADAKLSSARGLTQEALGETLATGKPGPKRTLAGG